MRYLLAHDLGTSGNKATLFSEEGKLIKSIVYSYNTNYYNSNWAEQDPNDWWKAVCETTREIVKEVDPADIAAVSFSGQMMGCLCVDKNGNPLRSSIIWADQRAVKEADFLEEKIGAKKFYQTTGHRISASYGLEKFLWIKNNQPEIYENTYKMLNCKDYIVYKLTGNFYAEYSDAVSTTIVDLNRLVWSDEIIEAAGIDGDKLPELVESTYVAGGVTAQAAAETGLKEGTKVVMGGGDGVCAAVGAGCVKEGIAYCVLGTSSWIAYTSDKPHYDDEMRTFNWPHMVPGALTPCGTTQSAGAAYSWLKNEIGRIETEQAKQMGCSPYDLLNKEIEQSVPGANKLMFLPYLMGERSPRWNPNAKGAFIGLMMEHKREDIIRSVMEGITFNLNAILNIFKPVANIDKLMVIGGGAKGPIWRRIMADMFDLPILKPNYIEEATSMGAAVAGGVGVGVFKDFEAINRFITVEDTLYPNEDNAKIYKKMVPVFEECYHSLVGVYDMLAQL